MSKIVIHVEGGLIQDIYADCDVEIEVYDLDNEDFDRIPWVEESREYLDKISKDENFKAVY